MPQRAREDPAGAWRPQPPEDLGDPLVIIRPCLDEQYSPFAVGSIAASPAPGFQERSQFIAIDGRIRHGRRLEETKAGRTVGSREAGDGNRDALGVVQVENLLLTGPVQEYDDSSLDAPHELFHERDQVEDPAGFDVVRMQSDQETARPMARGDTRVYSDIHVRSGGEHLRNLGQWSLIKGN